MTDIAYPKLTQAEDYFKSFVWSPLLDTGLTALFTEAPFLALPVIKQIVTGLIRFFMDKFFEAVRLFIDLAAIGFINAAHQRAFDDATVRLHLIGSDKGIGSDEYKKAYGEAAESLSRFVRFGNFARLHNNS